MNDLVIGQSCPKCGHRSVVYNGNYWCERCTWVMPERGKHNDRIIKAYLLQRRKQALAAGNDWEVERMDGYLANYADKEQQ